MTSPHIQRLDDIEKILSEIGTMVTDLRADYYRLHASATPCATARAAIGIRDVTFLNNYSSSVRPTSRQESYIRHLCEKHNAYITFPVTTQRQASAVISRLRTMPEFKTPDPLPSEVAEAVGFGITATPTPPRVEPEKIPFNTLEKMIPQGRYAVTSTDGKQTLFMMIRHRDKLANGRPCDKYITISLKSSGVWSVVQTYWNDGRVRGRNEVHGTVIADALSQIMLDTSEAAIRYAERFGECTRCGRELTDDKSRYYSLGTECIKHRATLVAYIDSKRGVWTPGAAS